MEWQSIETAPKDGTDILLLTPSGIIEAWFSCGKWQQNVCEATHDGEVYLSQEPTHWMQTIERPEEKHSTIGLFEAMGIGQLPTFPSINLTIVTPPKGE